MDLYRDLAPAHLAIHRCLASDDLADWARERLRAAELALSEVLDAVQGPECRRCGAAVAAAGTGRPAAYCSPACRQAAYRERIAGPPALGMWTLDIYALRSEAGASGDLEMVAICERALEGDPDAISECTRVLDEAAARG